jgi:glutaredoxin 3
MSATKTKVQSIIDENPVAVFSKSYCPYCRAAKQLLSENGAKFYAIELDQVGTFALSGARTRNSSSQRAGS